MNFDLLLKIDGTKMSGLKNLFRKASRMPGGQSYEIPTTQQARAFADMNEWPKRPQTVKREKYWTACDIAVDILLTCCCLAFLIFALLVRGFHGARVEDHKALTEGMRKATTYVSPSCSRHEEADYSCTFKGSYCFTHSLCHCHWSCK